MPDPFDLLRLRDAARAAPSILNTKPWVFRIVADDCIQLYADPRSDPNYPGRKLYLKVTDERAREMIISCGAALFNLVLAIRVTGHDPVIDVVQGRASACGWRGSAVWGAFLWWLRGCGCGREPGLAGE